MSKALLAAFPCALLAGCIWLYPGPHAPRHGTLDISGYVGNICIQPNFNGETFAPRTVYISTRENAEWREVWKQEFPLNTGFMIESKDCIPIYGGSDVIPLSTRVAYHISASSQAGPARRLRAEFCLLGEPGELRIHQVRYDKHIGGRDWAPCNLILPPLP